MSDIKAPEKKIDHIWIYKHECEVVHDRVDLGDSTKVNVYLYPHFDSSQQMNKFISEEKFKRLQQKCAQYESFIEKVDEFHGKEFPIGSVLEWEIIQRWKRESGLK